MTETPSTRDLSHRIRRMNGRDPDERHRVASSLELLFDLTFVIGFGQAAYLLVAGRRGQRPHPWPSIPRVSYSLSLRIRWAWINFAWFASAFRHRRLVLLGTRR